MAWTSFHVLVSVICTLLGFGSLTTLNQHLIHSRSILSAGECDVLIAAAQEQGLHASLPASRALDPFPLSLALSQPLEKLDFDGDGLVDAVEAASLVRSSLNAPLFTEDDARKWLNAAVGAPNVSAASLADLRTDDVFNMATHRFFAELLATQPDKFSRDSEQTALHWEDLLRRNATRNVAQKLVDHLARLSGWDQVAVTGGEPLQVIRYRAGGHYAPHSDSGWPGHRPITALVYLRAPEVGGETCVTPSQDTALLEITTPKSAEGVVASEVHARRFARDCVGMLTEVASAVCFKPVRGDIVLWKNEWREDGSLEVPSAHAACPVLQGEKWVATAWISEPCPEGQICSFAGH